MQETEAFKNSIRPPAGACCSGTKPDKTHAVIRPSMKAPTRPRILMFVSISPVWRHVKQQFSLLATSSPAVEAF